MAEKDVTIKKMLIYISPWIEQDNPKHNYHWVPEVDRVVTAMQGHGVQVSLVCGELEEQHLKRLYSKSYRKLEKIIVLAEDLLSKLSERYKYPHKLYANEIDPAEINLIADYIKSKLGQWQPDLIFSFVNSVPFLKAAFKESRIVYFEAGGLFQPPFPKSWYFDIFGDRPCEYILKYKQKFRELQLTQEQSDFISRIRDSYLSIISQNNPFIGFSWQKKFKYNILLPLQVSNIPSYDQNCQFQSQFHYLDFVLRNIPDYIGVIVTEHPAYPHISKWWNEYFSTKYKNYNYSPEFQTIRGASQYLLEYADGLVTVSSTVTFQSLWLQKPLFVLGSNYLSVFSYANDLGKIEEVLAAGEHQQAKNNDAILYHLITRYWILDRHYADVDFLYKFLSQLCFEANGLETYTRQFDDEQLLSEILGNMKNNQNNPAERLNVFDILNLPHMPMSLHCHRDFRLSWFKLIKMILAKVGLYGLAQKIYKQIKR